MSVDRQWYDNRYWTEALAEYPDLKAALGGTITLDLVAIERSIHLGSSLAFELQQAMARIERDEDDPDRYRGVPRVFLAMLVHLHKISIGQWSE